MTLRSLLLATLAGTVAIFAWQTVSNTALDAILPWHSSTVSAFQNTQVAVNAIRAVAPENGLYVAGEGVMASVAFRPDMADQSGEMAPRLFRQFAIDLIAVAIMVLIVSNVDARQIRVVALILGVAGMAASVINYWSLVNWYGFPIRWAVVNTLDQGIGWLLAGLAVGAVASRAGRATA